MLNKIKFIATDMDGTLLDSDENLPDDFFDVFENLYNNEILFSVASGRQYSSLIKTFEPIKDRMIFIGSNGSLVMHKGIEVYSAVIAKTAVHEMIKLLRSIAHSHIILCGKKADYLETRDAKALSEIRQYYHDAQCVDDLLEVDDDFIKVAVLNYDGTEQCVYPRASAQFESTHQVLVISPNWLDFMHNEASKGTAIKYLRQKFNFSFEESMSFGDYFNDIEMLQETYHSYAMANAHPDIKRLARFEAPSNDVQGVMSVIKSTVL